MPLRPQAAFVPRALPLLALFAGASPGHAEDPLYAQTDNLVALPQPLSTFARSCTGDVDGDMAPDVAVLADGRVFVSLGISAHVNLIEVFEAGSAIDLALTPRLGPGSRSQIAFTHEDGLFLVGRQPDPQNPAPWVTEQVLASDLALKEASRVRSADLDGNGRSDLIVVLADEKTVRVLLRQLDGSWSGSLAPFTLPTKARDLTALQYDFDAPLELAIQTLGSARVYEFNGTFVAMARNVVGGSPAGMAVMPIPGSTPARERVAYLATGSAGYDLHLMESGVPLNTMTVAAGAPRALLAADHDQDGDFDLLVDHGESGSLELWLNSEADVPGPDPDPAHPFVHHMSSANEFQLGPQGGEIQVPIWSDLDNDDQADLLVPGCPGLGTWQLEFHPRVPAPSPYGFPMLGPEDHPVFKGADWADPTSATAPRLRVFLSEEYWEDNERSHIQVTVWRKQTPLDTVTWTGPATQNNGRFNGFYLKAAVSPDVINRFPLTLPIHAEPSTSEYFPTFHLMDESPGMWGTNTTLFFIEVRSVDLDSSNQIVSAGRKQIAGLALNGVGCLPIPCPDSSFQYLAQYPGSWGVSVPTIVFESGFDQVPGDYKIGGLVPMPTMPPFGPGFLVNPLEQHYP